MKLEGLCINCSLSFEEQVDWATDVIYGLEIGDTYPRFHRREENSDYRDYKVGYYCHPLDHDTLYSLDMTIAIDRKFITIYLDRYSDGKRIISAHMDYSSGSCALYKSWLDTL